MPRKQSSLSFAVWDEQLLIRRRGAVSHRIRIWPRPNAEKRDRMGNWERFYPEFRIISYPLPKPKKKPPTLQLDLGLEIERNSVNTEPTKKEAYDQLRQTMPRSYAMALAPFKSHQWNMILFLSFKRRFYDLIKTNPALAFSLANRREFNWKVYRKEISLDDLTGMKQTELLELLGLPGTKSLAQITKKIQPASVSVDLVDILRHCLHYDSIMKKLSHLKKINTGVLTLLTRSDDIRNLVTPQLLEEVSLDRAHNHYAASAHQLGESLRWHRELRPDLRFPIFQTLEALNAYHEEIVGEGTLLMEEAERIAQIEETARAEDAAQAREIAQIERTAQQQHARASKRTEQLKKLKAMLSTPFPKPPIEGTSTIQALQTTREIRIEGHTQRNCVAGYATRIQAGTCYIYRVLKPERATLSIIRPPGGEWRIGELMLSSNRNVKRKTRVTIGNWLNESQLGV